MNPKFKTVEELILLSQSNQSMPIIESFTDRTQYIHNPNTNIPFANQPFIDVHTFDYSYANEAFSLDIPISEKYMWLEKLIERMANPVAIEGTKLIMANIDQDGNLDRTNNKRAEDILVYIAQFLLEKDDSLLSLVEEQMQDMVQLGQCAQGRTTRFWQIYMLIPKNEIVKNISL
jgi:hypothetical protein